MKAQLKKESTSSLHEKLEIENNTEEDLHQGKSSTPATVTPEADLKVSSQPKSGPENTPVVPQSRPKKTLDSDVKKGRVTKPGKYTLSRRAGSN